MTKHDHLHALLQQALPRVPDQPPSRDLWPAVRARRRPAPRWTWLDLGAAVAIVILLSLFPEHFWLLLYHL
jgi:hypothetical protein